MSAPRYKTTLEKEIAITLRVSQFETLAEMLWKSYYTAEQGTELEARYRSLILQVSTHTELITARWLEKRLARLPERRLQSGAEIVSNGETLASELPLPIAEVST